MKKLIFVSLLLISVIAVAEEELAVNKSPDTDQLFANSAQLVSPAMCVGQKLQELRAQGLSKEQIEKDSNRVKEFMKSCYCPLKDGLLKVIASNNEILAKHPEWKGKTLQVTTKTPQEESVQSVGGFDYSGVESLLKTCN